MNWERRASDNYACFELSFPQLKIAVVARHDIANWIVFNEVHSSDGEASPSPVKPIVWGECDDSLHARAEAEMAVSVIRIARAPQRNQETHAFWPESTTGLVYAGASTDRLLVPGSGAAQRSMQPWGLRPYYEGHGGLGRLVLIDACWAPSAWTGDRKEENAIIWTGTVRDAVAADEMALGLAALFSDTKPTAHRPDGNAARTPRAGRWYLTAGNDGTAPVDFGLRRRSRG